MLPPARALCISAGFGRKTNLGLPPQAPPPPLLFYKPSEPTPDHPPTAPPAVLLPLFGRPSRSWPAPSSTPTSRWSNPPCAAPTATAAPARGLSWWPCCGATQRHRRVWMCSRCSMRWCAGRPPRARPYDPRGMPARRGGVVGPVPVLGALSGSLLPCFPPPCSSLASPPRPCSGGVRFRPVLPPRGARGCRHARGAGGHGPSAPRKLRLEAAGGRIP